MTDLLEWLLALGTGEAAPSSAQTLREQLEVGDVPRAPAQGLDVSRADVPDLRQTTAEGLAEALSDLAGIQSSLDRQAAQYRTEAAAEVWRAQAQDSGSNSLLPSSGAPSLWGGGWTDAGLEGTRAMGFEQSAGTPPLERVAVQSAQGEPGLSLSALDRIMERDARRYDNGFPLY